MFIRHLERHRTERIGWLRAAVLGANDGIVSTASLVVGVAAANAAAGDIVVAGVAGMVAGAMSMAAGEYVSVSSQADTERADLARERKELATDAKFEHEELAAVYVKRGLDEALAKQVATQLMAHDSLAAHARDELGISDMTAARPVQAALASAGTFAVGAAMPLLTVLIAPGPVLIPVVIGTSVLFLAVLGGFGAHAGGAPVLKAAVLRVTTFETFPREFSPTNPKRGWPEIPPGDSAADPYCHYQLSSFKNRQIPAAHMWGWRELAHKTPK